MTRLATCTTAALGLCCMFIFSTGASAQHSAPPANPGRKTPFKWPDGKRVAISLSFDDARLSQPDVGLPLLTKLGVKATFYALPSGVEERLEGWKKIVAAGHEIGSHSQTHPYTGTTRFP